MALGLAATPSGAETRAHTRSTDPFDAIERESQSARRAEARDHAEALEENDARIRERERSRLIVDDDANEIDDTDMEPRAD